MKRKSWLWENFWSQDKKAREANLPFRELIERLSEDSQLYRESKRKGEEIFGWSGLSRKKLAWIRSDIELLRSKIKNLSNHSHIREEAQKIWGALWSQKIESVRSYLKTLEGEVNSEMLLLHDSEEDLKFIIETNWSPRRRKAAEENLQRLRS